MPTNGFSIKPLKVKLLAGEQKATEICSDRSLFVLFRSAATRQITNSGEAISPTKLPDLGISSGFATHTVDGCEIQKSHHRSETRVSDDSPVDTNKPNGFNHGFRGVPMSGFRTHPRNLLGDGFALAASALPYRAASP